MTCQIQLQMHFGFSNLISSHSESLYASGVTWPFFHICMLSFLFEFFKSSLVIYTGLLLLLLDFLHARIDHSWALRRWSLIINQLCRSTFSPRPKLPCLCDHSEIVVLQLHKDFLLALPYLYTWDGTPSNMFCWSQSFSCPYHLSSIACHNGPQLPHLSVRHHLPPCPTLKLSSSGWPVYCQKFFCPACSSRSSLLLVIRDP